MVAWASPHRLRQPHRIRPGPVTMATGELTYRTVVVDDHELLRAGTRQILEDATGFTVVGEAADAEAAREVVADTDPDLVIADIRLPGANGIELARQLVHDRPGLVVVMLSAYDDPDYVRAAMAAGVAGYLLKTLPSHELVEALRDACAGTARLGGPPRGRGERDIADRVPEPYDELTAREVQVVRLVARGMSNKTIANELEISPRTVEGHLNHVFDKVGVESRTELVHYALANSLFGREPATDAADPDRHPGSADAPG
jgi:DNA-binding NarL/FixJ family response regulator